MRQLAWKVPRLQAEEVRRALRDGGWLHEGLPAQRSGSDVLFPLRAPPVPAPSSGELLEAEFPEAAPAPPGSYRDLLDLPEREARALPRSYDVVGDIVLVRIPRGLEHRAEEIGNALLQFVPGARLVAQDQGVHGPERLRRLVALAGSGSFRTVHRENGLAIEVDVARAYFSPRLGREHAVVAAAVQPGERVLDLCCGVGPFSLTIARDGRAASVTAVDANPDAIALLRDNLARLGLVDRVRAVEARIEAFLPLAGVADRVVLNLPHEGIKYAPSVGTVVAPHGTLHYYEVTERSTREGRPQELASRLGPAACWRPVEVHVVHPYSPTADLVAYTLERS